MPNNNTRYQQSIASEFLAIKDRVKFFIEDNHWGEDGRYKEIILMNFLRRVLPDNVAVGTGFVKNRDGQLTDQIDVIIYKKNEPKLFSEGDFVILMPESIIGVIEVKSKATYSSLCRRKTYNREVPSAIDKSHRNGEIIGRHDIFNGIFSYETDISFQSRFSSSSLFNQLKEKSGYVNHICFDHNFFMRYWSDGNPNERYIDQRPCYSFYNLSYRNIFNEENVNNSGFALGYFISNLLETVYHIVAPDVLNRQYFEFLYPLEQTKENYRIAECEIKIDNVDEQGLRRRIRV